MISGKLICMALAAALAQTVNSAAVASSSAVSTGVASSSATTPTTVPSSSPTVTPTTISTVTPTTTSPTTTSPPTSTPSSFLLHPNGNTAKCLDVRGAVFENGTPVQIYDCNGTPAQNWVVAPGEGHVQLAGTGFCLDAGASPANGVGMKIWQCFDNLPAQDWFYTNDDRIALTNQGFCLDLTNGNLANANQVQIWHCTDNDVFQIWTTSPGSSINSTTSAVPSTAPVTSTISA
ncbi:hypothetical protein NP233_g3987 [Leucocoprinus birnbaumii]|uniref:Ricin B lectin domain-containing protein n=1 Tax=Leucocoprinus birnbaumii TaxID=56174 RepID=A0AAD5W265_9AGAR|nr:hypothetical protein NP233_g3987 [Leucocoprinus birnbaumii]